MERLLQQYSKEYLKMAMLKHEETFREQVNELHRLYQVQKLLMGDEKREIEQPKKKKFSHCQSCSYRNKNGLWRSLEVDRPAEEETDLYKESDVELTLSLGSSQRKKTEESGTSFSSSSTETSGVNSNLQNWGPFPIPDMNLNFPSPGKNFALQLNPIRWDGGKQPSWQVHYQRLHSR